MKHLFYFIVTVIILMPLLFTACDRDDIETFNGIVAGIYLQRTSSYNMDGYGNITTRYYSDSTSLSFADSTTDVMQIRTYITANVMGYVTDYDRPFILKVDEQTSTAVRGTNFDYNEDDCVISAGSAQTRVPITLYRTSDLAEEEKEYRVEFYLEPNEYFTVELERYKNTTSWTATGDTLCGTRYKIIFSELYTEPWYYSLFGGDYFGTWSMKKEQLINSLMGWTHTNWDDGTVLLGVLGYAATLTKNYLQAAADSGNPILDEDGQYMQLAGSYVVDYSDYE